MTTEELLSTLLQEHILKLKPMKKIYRIIQFSYQTAAVPLTEIVCLRL